MYYLKEQEVIKYYFIKKIAKRLFDFTLSFLLIIFFSLLIVVLIFLSSIYTKSFGLFTQRRIGRRGKTFTIFKIRTINNDGTISRFGRCLRKIKLDELPQLFNILIGNMSFVGPRPDIEGFADKLEVEDKVILLVKPGLTGPATLKFINEEQELAKVINYEETVNKYWKKKVEINKKYVMDDYFYKDVYFIYKTFIYILRTIF